MDTVRERDVGVGETISNCEGREGLRGKGEMNNSLTGGIKKTAAEGVWSCVLGVCSVVCCSAAFGSYITLIQQEDIA